MRGYTAIVIIGFLFFSCNSSRYITKNFEEKTAQHQQVALLPVSVIYKGRIPIKLSQQEVQQINRLEGIAFQKGIVEALVRAKEENISKVKLLLTAPNAFQKIIADSTSSSNLCTKLGVDAVLVTQIEKEKLLPHLEHFGIATPTEILAKMEADSTGLNSNLPQIPGNAQRTVELKIESTLYDKNNTLLWKEVWYIEMQWSNSEKEIITQVAERYKKKFPYTSRLVTDN